MLLHRVALARARDGRAALRAVFAAFAVAPAFVLRDVPFASAGCTGGVFVGGVGSWNAGTCWAGGGVYGAGGT